MQNYLDTFEYKIKPGDNLSTLITSMYEAYPGTPRYNQIIRAVSANNPHIKDPNFIRSGDILVLVSSENTTSNSAHPQTSSLRCTKFGNTKRGPTNGKLANTAPSPFYSSDYPQSVISSGPRNLQEHRSVPYHPPFSTQTIEQEERDLFWALSWMSEHSSYMTTPASALSGAAGNLLNEGNTKLITSVADNYADYKNKLLTKGQYDYQRKLALEKLSKNLGPSEKWLFGGKTTKQSVRIARAGGVPATQNIKTHAAHLGKLAKVAKYGGIVLTGVSVTASCMQVANTQDKDAKNDIIVETISSTAVGVAAGAAVSLFLVSNPVGWGTAILLAAGTAALSYGAGKAAKDIYDISGRPVDLHTGLGIDNICK